MRKLSMLLALIFASSIGAQPPAKTPEASLQAIKVAPGFVVELVAAEPLVKSPIAFAWGADGKLWVVEMGDYPLGLDGHGKPGGIVRYLESTKGDGKYDKSTVFLDGLNFPTGILPWGKGVLVTCAPEIFYAEDTKGTGKADKRVPLYTGFVEGNQQHRVNSLVRGLDNWIYVANGDSGGKIKSVKTGAVVDIAGRDLRIRPDDGLLDAESGRTQFGRSRDDWGNWFGNNNSNPMYHFVLADHYLRRNPHLSYPDPRVQVSVVPGAAQVFPSSVTLPRFNDPHTANHFTSACSAIVYRDDLFGPDFADNTFVSEPVHNLIHREIMTPKGVTFSSHRAANEERSEFLASSDNWFRPTTIQTGPDGALWIADMYRQVIEHPQWIPPDWQRRLDLRAGHDKGRLYRVYPTNQKPRAIPRLDRLSGAQLVAALDSPSGWQRDLAQQLLIDKQNQATVPALEKLASQGERPLARLHALCTLDGLHALKPAVLQNCLADPHPGVRRHVIRLCENGGLLQSPELGAALVKLVADPDPQVRLQLACTLGEWDDPRAGRALAQLAVRESGDRYVSAAVMSSVNKGNLDTMVGGVLTAAKVSPPSATLVENLLRLANAHGNTTALSKLLNAVGKPVEGNYAAWQLNALAGLLDALDQRNMSLRKLVGEEDAELKASIKLVAGIFDFARASGLKKDIPEPVRLAGIRLLGRGLDHQQEDLAILGALLVPQVTDEVQAAAVSALGYLRGAEVPELLLHSWKNAAPALRAQVLDTLLRREAWQQALLDAIDSKQVMASEIDTIRRQRLLDSRSTRIREKALQLFAGASNVDRQKVLREYQSVLTLKGDATRGLAMFTKHCSSCHKLGDIGHVVGPDLASIGDKSPEALLVAVLDPNRAVEARYINYLAITKSGLSFTGVLANESGTSITLLGPEGKQQIVLRKDLEELISSGKSAMPEGLEKDVKPQDLADVIAHVRGATPLPQRKVFEGNKPELVKAALDGSLLLSATASEVYGSTLVWEKQHQNLGYWSSIDDHALWSVAVEKGGRYAVWLDWACPAESAGNAFVLQAGLERLTGRATGTTDWDTYRQAKVGDIALQAGPQNIVFRSVGKIRGSLLDLKGIKLVPLGPR